ncbi:hypothetical protein DNI29_10525 [Hymenobacter sediminis]|uniref:hypothetical protein n=1 Tax=Hymenobacter sediminis TaxID=2218621 RepID=UPI000F510CF1|nr:hypothetical protein [Hymenobacter sediminis]RPD47863.1 hypothetical protein DNI29_10525 [Hymenobacter sediminis]
MTAPTVTSLDLQLHLVPAGCRLDFSRMPGLFAYVYRRQTNQPWLCIAHNACSPHIDRAVPAGTGLIEYVVCYCDAAGNITATTPIVQTPAVPQPPHSQPTNRPQLARTRQFA